MSLLHSTLKAAYKQSRAIQGTQSMTLPDGNAITITSDSYNLSDQSEIGGYADDIAFTVSCLSSDLAALPYDDLHDIKGTLVVINSRTYRITGLTAGETITHFSLTSPDK